MKKSHKILILIIIAAIGLLIINMTAVIESQLINETVILFAGIGFGIFMGYAWRDMQK